MRFRCDIQTETDQETVYDPLNTINPTLFGLLYRHYRTVYYIEVYYNVIVTCPESKRVVSKKLLHWANFEG